MRGIGQGFDATVVGKAGTVKSHFLHTGSARFFSDALANGFCGRLVAALANRTQCLTHFGFSG